MDISALAASTANSASAGAAAQLTANFDTFLKLLTTQLRHQDPLQPLDTEKFTSQLVQFASVEQSIRANSHLETLIALQAAGERSSALSLVGRTVSVAADKAMHSGAGAGWTYTLPGEAQSVTVTVVDSLGRVAATLNSDTGAGAHSASWNGETDKGETAPSGVYRLIVTAKDAAGLNMEASISTDLRIDAVAFEGGATKLETVAGLVDIAAVRRVAALQ